MDLLSISESCRIFSSQFFVGILENYPTLLTRTSNFNADICLAETGLVCFINKNSLEREGGRYYCIHKCTTKISGGLHHPCGTILFKDYLVKSYIPFLICFCIVKGTATGTAAKMLRHGRTFYRHMILLAPRPPGSLQ